MAKRILVTGASGFVGTHLTLDLASLGFEVTATGNSTDFASVVRNAAREVYRGDLANLEFATGLIKNVRPDIIVHAAACADAAKCESDHALAETSNIQATNNLVTACTNFQGPSSSPLFFYLSTDLVFGSLTAPANGFSENEKPAPLGIYGHSKLRAEQIVLQALPRAIICRLSLIYGDNIEGRGGFMDWLRSRLADGMEAQVYFDEFRTPLFVNDIATFVTKLAAMEQNGTISQRVLHMGGPERMSRVDFAEQVAKHFGYDQQLLKPVSRLSYPGKIARPADVSLDSRRLWTMVQHASTDFRSALKKFVQ